MAISAKDVMELRKQTDCGMMECKKALTDAEGDFAKAIELLRERGLATAAKKAGRVAAEGMVYADYCPECKVGVVIEVNAETDFVAKNDKFVEFVKEAAKVIMQQNPADVEALMSCKMGEGSVDDALKQLILVIKENIKVRRFVRYEGPCAAYVHGGGTHAVLVNFETSDGSYYFAFDTPEGAVELDIGVESSRRNDVEGYRNIYAETITITAPDWYDGLVLSVPTQADTYDGVNARGEAFAALDDYYPALDLPWDAESALNCLVLW